MTQQFIRFACEAGVARIALARPDVLNSLNRPMARELQAAFDECAQRDDVRAVLLTGTGRAFCAGQDLAEIAPPDGSPGPEVSEIVAESYNPLVRRILALEKPVVCAVNGVAAGAGANLALACDLVIASRSASFLQAFVNIGLIPDSGGTFLLPRLVGLARAKTLAFLGERISAEQAHAIGLIHALAEPDALEAESSALAARLAALPTRAIGLAKRAFHAEVFPELDAALERERALQGEAAKTADYAEGVRAFLAKRKPAFTGR
ncbi:MAG TPA: enoyl-CoA hydratase-related protein [Myxococcota bacterium]|nr:enoyl-CoA hydratase-related protein [Myxococcota bacterium]